MSKSAEQRARKVEATRKWRERGGMTEAEANQARRAAKKRTEWVAMFAPIVGEEAALRALSERCSSGRNRRGYPDPQRKLPEARSSFRDSHQGEQ